MKNIAPSLWKYRYLFKKNRQYTWYRFQGRFQSAVIKKFTFEVSKLLCYTKLFFYKFNLFHDLEQGLPLQ